MPEKTGSKSVAARARRTFADWVAESPNGRLFGQVVVRKTAGKGFSVSHVDDLEAEDLDVYEDPREAREIARFTEEGEYRPLKSSPNLRRGWRLDLGGEEDLSRAMNYLYPAGVAHWYLQRRRELDITTFQENAARQSGIYERVRNLSGGAVQNAARACCEDAVCLKRTLWDVDENTLLQSERGEGEIPCPEPCSIFISFARKIRTFEREERYAGEDGLTPSEKEDILAVLGAATTGEVRLAREAEFDKPLNERRMRYRKVTLGEKLIENDGT